MQGWDVFLIEPVSKYADLASKLHEARRNVRIFSHAISNDDSGICLNVAGTLTTSNNELYNEYKELDWAKANLPETNEKIMVNSMTLDSFIENNLPDTQIDILIIDVEGSERDVINGFDLKKYMPKMIIIELPDFHPDIKFGRNEARKIYQLLCDTGYIVIYKDAINTCFLLGEVWQNLDN